MLFAQYPPPHKLFLSRFVLCGIYSYPVFLEVFGHEIASGYRQLKLNTYRGMNTPVLLKEILGGTMETIDLTKGTTMNREMNGERLKE